MGRDFHYSMVGLETSRSVFDFKLDGQVINNLSLTMLGEHQVWNASVAVAAALQLREAGFNIPTAAIRDGLAQTRVPGRLEILPEYPNIILDGAHSPPKMEALSSGLRTLFPGKERVIGVLSFSKGHDAQDTLGSLAPMLSTAILTEFTAETDYGNKRAQNPHEVALILSEINPSVQIILEPDPICAIEKANRMARSDDLICVTGSIFLVGQVRKFLTLAGGGI
jgi:dihydrofolate synthase/folylpolyglutamate synthase